MMLAPHEIADLRKAADDAKMAGAFFDGEILHRLLDDHEAIQKALEESEFRTVEELLEKARDCVELEENYEALKAAVYDAKIALDGVLR